ncbi:autotransporter outer membrane beta-barrel domain-containing protein [Yersinia kristensenii]|uniref:autotransporter outer membrane beta-barrel domain-containing protein n=1 Tax=Yersinia kristensenii TaxID=28152 RepID=UPI000C2230B6|nr:autotransporter outer membrane beta-barrel domain-containing protein [Yersinia kristensenii]PJG63503.1 autotransporter outer membrane beta-barrel domain-containing protein [Yersinia kristensenii]
MNAIFKVIWNRSLNVWVAVGEFAKGKQKSTTTQRSFISQSVGDTLNQYIPPKMAILAVAVMSAFGIQPASAITPAQCTAMGASCIAVGDAANLGAALGNVGGAGSVATTILLTANIDLSTSFPGGITVNQAANARQHLVIDGGGYDLKFAGYAFNMVAGSTNNAAWATENATFKLTNFKDITSTFALTSGTVSRLVYVQDATTRLSVTLDDINSVPNGKLVAMGADGAALTPNNFGRVIFGNITQPITLNFGTYRQSVVGNNIAFTGKFYLTGITSPDYPAVFWSNGSAANSVLTFAQGSDVSLTGTRLTNGPGVVGTDVASYNYMIEDGAKLQLNIGNQNPLGVANYGVQIGSYNTATGLFGAGAVINMNNLAGDVISNAPSTTTTSYIYNGPASTRDVIYNLAAGSNLVAAAGAGNDGITASKTLAGTGGIYIRSAAVISDGTLNTTAGTGINVSAASSGNVVIRNEAQGTIRKATGISVIDSGSGSVNITNAGTINSTTAGLSFSVTTAKTVSVDNTGGTINASSGTGVNILANALLKMVGGTITTTGAATGFTFAGTTNSHILTDLILNLNGAGAAFSKAAGVNLTLNHVTLNTVIGTALDSLAGLTFATSANGRNQINVTGTGTGIATVNTALTGWSPAALDINVSGAGTGINASGGGVDLSGANLNVSVTNSGGTGLRVADGAVVATTIGTNAKINAAGATAISFAGTAAKSLNNNGTINGAVTFAGSAANTINNSGILNGTLTTGAGNDTLVLGSTSQSNGLINLGDGSNNVTIQNGAQVSSIVSGAGNDTFTINNMTAGNTYLGALNAGSGSNTLNFNSSTDSLATATSLQGFTNINLTNSQIGLSSVNNVGSGSAINIGSNSKLLFNSTFNGTLNASLAHVAAGDGLAVVNNGANVTLNQANAFEGGWQVAQGAALTASNSNQLGTATIALGGTLNLNDVATFNNALTGNGTLNIDTTNNTFNFGVNTGTAFAGTVEMKNSIFTLSGDNTAALRYSSFIASAGTEVAVGNGSQVVGNFTFNGGTAVFAGDGVINATRLAVTANSDIRIDPTRTTSGNLLDQDTGVESVLINTYVQLSDDVEAQLTLRNIQGDILGSNVLGNVIQGGNTVAQGTYKYDLRVSGGSLRVITSLSQLELLSGQTLTLTSQGALYDEHNFSARLTGAGNLVIGADNSEMTLGNSGSNYTGSTSVNGGILNMGRNNVVGQTSVLNTAVGTFTNINGYTQKVGALTNAGTVTLGTGGVLTSGLLTNSNILNIAGGTLNLSAGGASTATGGLTGSGTLNINGGDLAISAANSALAGQTNIASGATATLSGAGTLGTSAINVLGDLNLNGANAALANVLSGNGNINTNAAVTLTGNNTFSGVHHIGATGALTVTQASNLGASTARVGLDTATSHLVLEGIDGTVANVLSGVAGSTVDVTTGANTTLTGTNSNFLGQYALAGNSKLTVGTTANLGANSSVTLAGAQDTLALSGFSGTFGNTVTGSGILQVTGGSNAALTNNNAVANTVAVNIAGATLNLIDIALFDHVLTGNGTLNVAKNLASTAFDFGATVGGAFSGIVNLQNSTFDLDGLNTSALTNATLKLSSGNQTSVADGVQNIGALVMNHGTILFNNIIDNAGIITSEGTFAANRINTTGGGNVRVNLPTNLAPSLAGIPVMELDEGEIIVTLGTGAATGSGHELTLSDGSGSPIGSVFYQQINNPGVASAAANGSFNYGLTTGNGYDGLYVNYGLTALELLSTGNDALILTATLANNGKQSNDLSVQISGSGDLAFVSANDGSIASLSNETNNYTGATWVRSGGLRLEADSALGQTSLLDMSNATTVDLNGTQQTVGQLTTETGSILNFNDGKLSVTGGGQVDGELSGAGELVLTGGSLSITQQNTGFTASTDIASAASATLSGVGTLGASAVNVLGNLNLNGANAALANVLSGNGNINTNAAVTLTGTNTFSGAHHIGATGALAVTQASNLGASTATVGLDTATSHLVLKGVNGTVANVLSGVAGSAVDITTGANTTLTGTNSGFLGQYALAGNSKLTVGTAANLGASSSVNLAGAQDTLALSGFSGTFGNTVTGSGILQVTDSSNATLTSSNAVANTVAVDIANSTLNLTDIALFDHALTGNGTLNVAKNLASTAFDFGTSVGGAFTGTANLTSSTFALTADNTAALANATLKLSANNVTTVGSTDRTLHGLNLNGGTLIFDGAAPQSQTKGVVTVADLALNSGTVSVTGTSDWNNTNPAVAPNLSILAQDRGDIMLKLIDAARVTGDVNVLNLIINGAPVTSGGQAVLSTIQQGGVAVANATHNYGLTSSDGSTGTGLYVNYTLKALELLTSGNNALLLATESGATANRVLNATLSGSGGLQVDASNGALTLANSTNTYSGATTVNAGTLILGANNAFGRTSLLNVLSGAGTNINGHSQTVGALTNAGTVTLGTGGTLSSGLLTNNNILNIAGGTLNLSTGGVSTTTGGLTGSGILNINGGDLAISAANSGLAGQTNIANSASATLSGAGTLGSSGVNVLGNLNLNGANAVLANVLSGNGNINTNAAVTLSGTNTFSGVHHIGATGALTVGQASNLGASAATVGLDTATSHLVLKGVNGTVANALSGVAGSTVDVTTGANTTLTGNNSGFLGQYALAGNSKLTVGTTANLGASSNVTLAGAQDTLALSGFNSTFGNTVTGSGILQVTGGSNATLTNSNAVANTVAVDIADATLTLDDIALFEHALTGNGTLNVAKNSASTAFNFGTSVGGAFSGIVNLQNSTFDLDGVNSSALTNATLKLSSGNMTSVADGVQNIGALALNGGTMLFNHLVDNAGVIASEGTFAANSINTTGGGNVRVNLPVTLAPSLDGLPVMELDEGEIIVKLGTGAATGSGRELTLTDQNGGPISAVFYQGVYNPGGGNAAAIGSFNYGLTTGNVYDGLYVNYGLTGLELQSTGSDALILTATLANNGKQSNDLSTQISGSGDLAFVSANDGSIASLSNATNNYTGATWVRSGILRLNANSALGQTSQLAMSNTTTVDLNGTQQTVGQLTTETGSTLNFNHGKLAVTNGGQVDGALSGAGELALSGGSLSITQGNTGFTGSTDIANGATAHLYQAQGLGSGVINNNGVLNLDNTTGVLLNNLTGASGNAQLTNNANIRLTGDNSGYSGLFSTDAGAILTANSAQNLGNSRIANSGELILDTASVWELTNSITGSGALIKRGSGTVKIEGSTVSAGQTTIENGLLQLGSLPVVSALYVEESPLARSLLVSLASTMANLTSNVLITTTGSLGGYGKVTGNVENNGSLIMPNALTGGDFGTFTIDGNYTGNNGTVVFNTVLAGDSSNSDRLLITGNTAGQSYVTVNNIGGNGGRTSDGIKIINVGGDSAGQFTLNGRAVAGAYEYFLYQGSISSPTDGDWYLRTQVDERRPEPASYTANLAAANAMFVTTLADRAGETLYTDVFTGEEKTTSLWIRNEGTHNRSRDDSGELKTQDNRYVMQLGGDVAQWSRNAQDLWRVGVMAGYANSSSSSVSQVTGYRSNGSVDGYSVGMYGTWFANSQENTGAYVDSWLQYSWFNNQVDGQDLTTEKYDSKGFTAAVESGYIFKVGESAYSHFFIQPKAQVVWMGVKADSHTETNGTLVTGEGNNNIQTRLGAKAFISPIQSANKAKEPAFKPFVEANWIHNTKDFGTTLDGITVKQAGAANIAELKLGVEGQINKKLNLWGNVGQQLGNNGYSDSSITLGVKYNF